MVKRSMEGFQDTFRVSMPALLTVSRELSVAHHIPLGNLERAFTEREVIHWAMADLDLTPDEVGDRGSATRVVKLSRMPPKKGSEAVSGSPQSLVERLINKLEALSVLDAEERKE